MLNLWGRREKREGKGKEGKGNREDRGKRVREKKGGEY